MLEKLLLATLLTLVLRLIAEIGWSVPSNTSQKVDFYQPGDFAVMQIN
ncbi:hypothetical protein H6G74_09360 [Nostoc spongiaeforme FACHB-130]|uniref:Uncharacterized protein n=1 Tax=Nostoc spongiaeforme FACHB-130 TaxID=1357510 RepID=A0ABR8FSZ0_9NOSO|nr:hypothetical protein [Nostoc spongiaeforme]MBD2594532.1 hypothetical protein [Nostoc spongiaeforme FACHB-130]